MKGAAKRRGITATPVGWRGSFWKPKALSAQAIFSTSFASMSARHLVLLAKYANFLPAALIHLYIQFFQDIFQFLALEPRKTANVDAVRVNLVLYILRQQDM